MNTTGVVKLEESLDWNYEANNGSTMCTKIQTSTPENTVSINESHLESADNFFPQTSTPKKQELSHLEKQDSIISINSLCSNESDWSDEELDEVRKNLIYQDLISPTHTHIYIYIYILK